MKVKCTSKRQFKKILSAMMKGTAFKINNKDFHFYAALNYYCGVHTYKGYNVNYIPVGYCGFPSNYIYLTPKVNVQENDSDK